MSSPETTQHAVPEHAGGSYEVGPVDIIVLFSVVGFLIYYFCKPKKRDDEGPRLIDELVNLKTISTVTTMAIGPSFSSSFVAKMLHSEKRIAIFYGSQTGTAEEFSTRLAKDAARYGLKAGVYDPEECEMSDLTDMKQEITDSLAIFVMATYGEGDPTDNAVPFIDWLQGEQDLEGLNFAVFGLGNKTYEHYQSTGRFVDKRMEQLGGIRLLEIGEGDDDVNIEGDFVEWRERFWPEVCQFYGLARESRRTLSTCVPRDYSLKEITDASDENVFSGEITKLGSYKNQRPPYDIKNPYMSAVRVNRELMTGGDRSCMHIELDIKGSGLRYEHGDHVGIYPVNDPELVTRLGEMCDVDLDTVISLENVDADASKKHPFPCPTTYRSALSHYVDISSVVKLHVMTELLPYTSDKADLDKLSHMCNNGGKTDYDEWVLADHRHIVAVLEDLPSCRPPLDHLLELLPRLQCRYYSISSSPLAHPDRIHVTAVLVDWTTRVGRQQKGVATSWLKKLHPNDEVRVPIFVRRTSFKLPSRDITPVVMIGPGTGLAPFRGFIQERHAARIKAGEEASEKVGDSILFFGCRKRDEEFLYREELEEFERNGAISKLILAFSRDQQEKIYVTHRLRERGDEVWSVLRRGGNVYVCGDAKAMACDVQNIIIEILREHGGKSEEQASKFVKKLRTSGKYSEDVWS